MNAARAQPDGTTRAFVSFGIFALALAGLAALGAWLFFSRFAGYDDEGYILLSAREYFAHGRLYDGVYTQYGPAFFILTDLLQRLAGPIDHALARWFTLALWLGTAAGCAALVLRQTASHRLALFTLTATFLYLYFLPDEPFHPGAPIVFTLAFSLWQTARLIDVNRWDAVAALGGATLAVLALTKINVGALYFVGVGAWAAGALAPGRRAIGAVLILFAAGLMHTLLREAWVQIYLGVFAAGAVALSLHLSPPEIRPARFAGIFTATAAGAALLILGIVVARGTSLASMLDGVLLGPLRHPANYSYPVDWRPGTIAVATGSLAIAAAWPWLRTHRSAEFTDRIVVALRLGQLAALLVAIALIMHARVIGAVFSFVAPLLWTWVVPLRGATLRPAVIALRALLAMVLLLQLLHAYPVGGSQESWGTFLFVPLVALGLGEIRDWTATRRWWPTLATVLVALLVAKVAWCAREAHTAYASRAELGLPGAGHLRLPEAQRTATRILALNAAVHADQLFSEPGLFSFNLWTGLPTPTARNTTLWFTLLDEREQRAIIAAIDHAARPAVIVQDSLLELTRHNGVSIGGPLHEWLAVHFAPVFRTEGFAFCVRRGRDIAALNIAQLSASADGKARLDFCALGDGTPITSIEVANLISGAAPLVLGAHNAHVATATIDRAGHAAGPLSDAAWPLRFAGFTRLAIQFDVLGHALSRETTVLYLKDATGKILGEIRLAE